MKKLAMMMVLLFTVMGSTFAQEDDGYVKEFKRHAFNHVGINVGAGLEGISFGVAAPLTSFLEFEAGVNVMPGFKLKGDLDVPSQTITVSQQGFTKQITTPSDAKVNAEGNFSRTTFNVKAYLYPFGGNSKLFVAGGFSFGGKEIAKISGASPDIQNFVAQYPEYSEQIRAALSADVAGYEVKFDENFMVNGDIRCKSFRPYLGLGMGRLVPKNRIGLRWEVGCQFMGRMKVYQDDTELDINKVLEDNGNDDISKFIKDFKVYPCFKLSIVGRIL